MKNGKDWIYNTNVYEVNVRQYTPEGTFRALVPHLPRLKDMGVETLWLMPVTPISEMLKKGTMGSYYACSDYTCINPEFGSIEDFRLLVSEAHALGFRVIMDWVANHTGWDHVWTRLHPEWYKVDETTGTFKRASGMDDIIELDFSNADMRAALIGAMKFWIVECGIDGFRCDLAFWVELDFWHEARAVLEEIRPLFWLAEADPLDNPEYMQVFDAAYTWKWMHITEKFYKNILPLQELRDVLLQYRHAPGIKTWFTSNHDENSWNGTEYEKYGEMALALAVFSFTWPGIPLMYTGQELPNTRRLLFFDKDPLSWTEQPALHSFYKSLFNLKRTNSALAADADVFPVHTSNDMKVLSYLRKEGTSEILVILNFSPGEAWFHITDGWLEGTFTELFSGSEAEIGAKKAFHLRPWAYQVWIRK